MNYGEKWGNGFIVTGKTELEIRKKYEPLGFYVKGIGIGYDYNKKVVSLYIEKGEKK